MKRPATMTQCAWLWPVAMALCATLQAQPLVGKCLPASYGRAASGPIESFEGEFGSYVEFKGVRYGESLQGEGYVGVATQRVMLASLRFRDPRGAFVHLRSDELAISRAVAYASGRDRRVVCVLSPFSGLGSSGSFQSVAGLMAVRKPRGNEPLHVEAAVVRTR